MADGRFKKGITPWNKGNKTIKICVVCNNEFTGRGVKYCSRKCAGKARLGKVFSENLGRQKGCIPYNKGKKCPEISGENNGNWKGGISNEYKNGYNSFEYRNWRKSVFERDGYACRICGSIGYITAHHIKSSAHYEELRFDLNNGITLCEQCHSLTDNYKGRNKNKGRISKLNKTLS